MIGATIITSARVKASRSSACLKKHLIYANERRFPKPEIS
jgi:hypothetical protein